MTGEAFQNWQEANQRYLMASVKRVRRLLELPLEPHPDGDGRNQETMRAHDEACQRAREAVPGKAALDLVVAGCGLSDFERDVLLLCAGVELDAKVADACAIHHADPTRRSPTFGLALSRLPGAHWSALIPDRPLRHWRLIEVGPGNCLVTSPLRIDERILHHLAGAPYLDERLRGTVDPVSASPGLSPSHQAMAQRICKTLSEACAETIPRVIQICGADREANRAVAMEACRIAGAGLLRLPAADIPPTAAERTALIRLVEREALLGGSALLIEGDEARETDRLSHLRAFIGHYRNLLMVSAGEPLILDGRIVARFDIAKPPASEQHAVWMAALGPLASRLNGQVGRIVSQFRMNGPAIHAVSQGLLQSAAGASMTEENPSVETELWDACRAHSRPRFDNLARRLPATAHWDDLVLPESQKKTLRELVANVRRQATVYEAWGFAERSPRGLGITALFSGPSGTGKTMAAEVLANALRLDLYHIDLSAVVSKYIGETEKNLRRVFDAAEQGGMVLLFDEADALFGKRSEVKDSHDRYANIEVSYLLQRMEAYRGLAILTTNNKSAIDPAFLRRIRFVVQFPFPDANQRAEIWKRIFPRRTPVQDLDERKLARLNIAGGNIRNIALNAAFLAADQDRPVGMGDIRDAARTEYAKIEKPLGAAETGDWT